MGASTQRTWALPNGHGTAERRSLAMHRAIAARLDEATLAAARERVQRWLADGGPVDPRWASAWQQLLAGTPEQVAGRISEDTPKLTQLRQTTPFAGVLAPAERWAILREVW